MPIQKRVGYFLTFLYIAIAQFCFGQVQNSDDFYLYEDSSKQLTSQAALKLYKQGKFTKLSSNEVNIGFTRSFFWLIHPNLNDLPPDSLLLNIGHLHINQIKFFFAQTSVTKQQWLTGDHYSFYQRPVKATGFYFPINKKGIYMAQIDKANESLQLSFRLISYMETFRTEGDKKIIMALLTGIVLLLIIFNFYLFSLSKRMVYFLYVLYITGGWLWVLTNAGYGYEYFWPNIPWFASKARVLFIISTIIFSMLFLVEYIGVTGKRKLNIVLGFNIFLFILIIITLLTKQEGYDGLWWFYVQHLPYIVSFLYLVLTLWLLISEVFRGNTLANFYLAAMFSLIISVILQITFSVGGFNAFGHFFGYFGVSVGLIAEAVILTAGLAHSFNQYRIDKEKLLIEMNKQQQENTRILMEVQEVERNQVALQLHDVAGSLLSAAKLNLSSVLEKGTLIDLKAHLQVVKAEEAISLVSDMVRNLSHALSPVMLKQVGFKTSVEKIVAIFNASGKINIQLVLIGFLDYVPELNNHYTSLYSIIYELLNNIVKHSFATKALLQVAEYDNCFSIMAEDDGIGLQLNKVDKQRSIGMAAIKSRVSYFSGKVAFDNIKPRGLLITIEIPITNV